MLYFLLLASINCVVDDCAHAVVELFSLKIMSTGPTFFNASRRVELAGFFYRKHNIVRAGDYIDVEVRNYAQLVDCFYAQLVSCIA